MYTQLKYHRDLTPLILNFMSMIADKNIMKSLKYQQYIL